MRRTITRIETIQPERARQLFDECRHLGQRTFREAKAETYRNDMRNGKFLLTTIRIGVLENARIGSEIEELLDGQHRLWAAWKSGVPVEFNVVYQYTDDRTELQHEYAPMDRGIPRNDVDIQKMFGMGETIGVKYDLLRKVNGAIRILAADFNNPSPAAIAARYDITSPEERARIPLRFTNEILAISSMLEKVDYADRSRFSGSAVLAVAMATMRFNEKVAKPLFARAMQNDGIAKGDPAHMLYRIVTRDSINKPTPWITRAIAGAYNAAVEGNSANVVSPQPHLSIVLQGTPWRGANTSAAGRAEIHRLFTDSNREGSGSL